MPLSTCSFNFSEELTPYFSMASQFSLLSLLLSNIIEALVSIGLDFLKASSNIPAFGFFLFLYYFCPTMITIPKEKKFIEERLILALIFQRDLSPLWQNRPVYLVMRCLFRKQRWLDRWAGINFIAPLLVTYPPARPHLPKAP